MRNAKSQPMLQSYQLTFCIGRIESQALGGDLLHMGCHDIPRERALCHRDASGHFQRRDAAGLCLLVIVLAP